MLYKRFVQLLPRTNHVRKENTNQRLRTCTHQNVRVSEDAQLLPSVLCEVELFEFLKQENSTFGLRKIGRNAVTTCTCRLYCFPRESFLSTAKYLSQHVNAMGWIALFRDEVKCFTNLHERLWLNPSTLLTITLRRRQLACKSFSLSPMLQKCRKLLLLHLIEV